MSVFSLKHTNTIHQALIEDLGHGHDITSQATIPEGQQMKAVIRARENGVLAGIECAEIAFHLVDKNLQLTRHAEDGNLITDKQDILTIEGNARSILMAERVALNFTSHLSGIASETARYVEAVKGTNASIVDTRKTLPNLRALQKYAVRMGGGKNHRFGLDDAILIKDNHIASAGGVTAVLNACKNAGHMVKIEIEVDTLEQLDAVLNHGGADIVLLDNMAPETLKKAVEMVDGRLTTEASGGVNIDTVRSIAESGVDLISIGALTHSVKVFDFGLDID